MKKVLVIAGPTASGKTAFSVRAAEQFHSEIISGDSIQVYRGLDIGSGKVTPQETHGIVHHLIDIRDPHEPYSVADFQTMARELIDRHDFSIIAGGTGLYLKACLYDYVFQKEEAEEPVDAQLEQLSNEELYALLKETDPVQAEKIHMNNRRRLLRSLTIQKRTGRPQSEQEAEQAHEPLYDIFIAGCTMPRDVLYERISRRVDGMFEAGLEAEVRGLLAAGVSFDDPGMQGIGYREFRPYMAGACTIDEVREDIKKHSRQYAKRQYTWLNHQMPVHWFQVLNEQEQQRMLKEIAEWKEENSNG